MQKRTDSIRGQIFDEERALYHLCDTLVTDCTFAGPADGESALKEARDITVERCRFSLRYPFWHTRRFEVVGCTLDALTRAPLWYSEEGRLSACTVEGVKCLRECRDMVLTDCRIVSPECGWRCDTLGLYGCEMQSEYALFESSNVAVDRLHLTGKYAFQYTRNVVVDHAVLDTKDAFWHAEKVTVRNTTLSGEYLGWYSKGLTLENCHITGTQPFCYCEDLTLINCTMENTDLAFEYAAVQADVRGHIVSVKNPKAGRITADSIGEIIREQAVMATDCVVTVRA